MGIAASVHRDQVETASWFGKELAGVTVVITAVAEASRAIGHALKRQQNLIKNHIITCSAICINGLKGQENGSAEIPQHCCASVVL